jgi:hypothetical protein
MVTAVTDGLNTSCAVAHKAALQTCRQHLAGENRIAVRMSAVRCTVSFAYRHLVRPLLFTQDSDTIHNRIIRLVFVG